MSIKYNADIDGLRAIAVLFVIFNHLHVSLFQGGFIGVDIFFVISGYLITSIIYKEMREDRFRIGHFYKKRVIRLAPAFFTMLAVVSIISSLLMLPHELMSYFESVIYSTFLMANVYMRKEVGGYFSTSVEEVPLLHLWSLGVEEQFYLFWPLLLLFLIRKINVKWLIWIVISLIMLSIFYAEQQILKNAGKAYYKMPVRACEMFLGALICFLPKIKLKETLIQIGIYSSVICLFATAMMFNQLTKFPGLNALIPCLATALIIYLSQISAKKSFILGNSYSVWFGKISYPMYLWHWPLIVFCNIYLIEIGLMTQVLIFVTTISLAYFTYKYIELPARKWVIWSNKKVIVLGFLLPSIGLSAIAGVVKYTHGLPERFDENVNRQVMALQSAAHVVRKDCHDAPKDKVILPDTSLCTLGNEKKNNIDLILLGDSHANSLAGAVDLWAKDLGLRGYDPTQSTTLYLPQIELFERRANDEYVLLSHFKTRNDSLTKLLQDHHYSIAVVSGYFSAYLTEKVKLSDGTGRSNQEVFEDGMRRAFKNISKASDRVVVILDVPELKKVKANCEARVKSLGLSKKCTISAKEIKSRDRQYLEILERLKTQFPKLEIVDLNPLLCDQTECQTSLNDIPLYRDKDNHHLSYYGALELGREYSEQQENPLKTR
ncbi:MULTISPECIES: acyltransferase family protein [Acinetobacter]|uniref:acyltransferase family protein n=1 Tax=Acinetobacter TaxID=469 RepID=UPI0015D2F5F8|nr:MULTISPECIES: acyltransferase family protein [Acinetobacter]MCO8059273.1 acyltransferase [Acinetobacter towneri]MCO8064998.1 acyltransferase [Acinetobacter towneri]